MSYRCNSSSAFVKVSNKRQKSVTKDFEIFPGGNGSVRLAVTKQTKPLNRQTIDPTKSEWQLYILPTQPQEAIYVGKFIPVLTALCMVALELLEHFCAFYEHLWGKSISRHLYLYG